MYHVGKTKTSLGHCGIRFHLLESVSLFLTAAMKCDDLPDPTTKKHRPAVLLVTIVVASIVAFFILLNIFVLRNASSFALSEQTQRFFWFSLNPEFWQDWVSQVLWMLAAGAVLATILRLRFIQEWLDHLAGDPFRVPRLPLRLSWIQKLAEYPVERWMMTTISLLLQKTKQFFQPRRLPLLVVVFTFF